jgi:16S rRNA (uracil1498-N3)-methyltransferase
MPHNRYYIDAPLEERGSLTLRGEEWHHLVRVHRAALRDALELVNGRGQLALCHVTRLNKQDAEIGIDRTFQQTAHPPAVILALGISRMNHLEWIVEKGTELDVTSFWLFPGLLSEKRDLSPTQKDRLKALCIAAMKQCGRLDLPEIVCKPFLSQWGPQEGTLFFGDTAADAPYLWDLVFETPPSPPIIIFTGPEKGFDLKERSILAGTLGARGVRLHRNVLRAETAPLVAVSLMQQLTHLLSNNLVK